MNDRLMACAVLAACAFVAAPASAQTATVPGDLKPYNVTIRRFDPTQDPARGQLFVLPVDSPDEEHAAASTLANAASFTQKISGGRVLPVAFMVVDVAPRR